MIEISSNNRPAKGETLDKAKRALVQLQASEAAGFLRVLDRESLWSSSIGRAQQVRDKVEKVVVVGIGGSSLGARVFAAVCDLPDLRFLENMDDSGFLRLLKDLTDLRTTHWIWVSKTGSTLETMAHLHFVHEVYARRGFNLADFSTVVTEFETNPLHEWAKRNQVATLEIPKDISGRFSVLTPVGLFPAALMGVEMSEVRDGTRWAMEQTPLIELLAALTFESWQRGEWITLLWNYSDDLVSFGDWCQQLWAESLTKAASRSGGKPLRASFPVPAVGAVDQHSILQAVSEGPRDKWVWMTRVKGLENRGSKIAEVLTPELSWLQGRTMGQILAAEAEATARALHTEGISCLTCTWEDTTPKVLGAAFMLMQMVIGTLGEMLDVNTFNQPGVERGKKTAIEILRNSLSGR